MTLGSVVEQWPWLRIEITFKVGLKPRLALQARKLLVLDELIEFILEATQLG